MADNLNTYGGLTAEQRTFYDRVLLERLTPELVYARFGQARSMPSGSGDTIQFRRFNAESANTTPLTEGQTPEGGSLSISTVTAQVQQYGDYKVITDKLDLMGIDPVITETVQLLGEKAGLTIDTLVRDALATGNRVVYAGNRANRGSLSESDVITSEDVKKAVRQLRNQKAKPFEDGCYVGIISPEVQYDLMSDPLWQDVHRYNGGEGIMKGEIGKLYGVRFVTTSNPKIIEEAGVDDSDVHLSFILGQNAFGIVDVSGTSHPQTIVKPLGSAGTNDPLDQRASVGYKFNFAVKILNEAAMLRIESVPG
jgi:N4-gp56 family major capsid protein